MDFPWATPIHDFTAESEQFLNLIKNAQNSQDCSKTFTSSKVSKNSEFPQNFKNRIFRNFQQTPKIPISKIFNFQKFQFPKTPISKNSNFQKFQFPKIPISKNSNFQKLQFLKIPILKNPLYKQFQLPKFQFPKIQISKNSNFQKFQFPKTPIYKKF